MKDLAKKLGLDYNPLFDFASTFEHCDPDLFIEYHINGHKFALEFEQFGIISDPETDNRCTIMVQAPLREPYTDTITWTLGQPFFKRYCHVYDYEKNVMGLAEPLELNDN